MADEEKKEEKTTSRTRTEEFKLNGGEILNKIGSAEKVILAVFG